MPCSRHRPHVRRWFVGAALLVLLAGAGLETEGVVRSELARHALRAALREHQPELSETEAGRLAWELASRDTARRRDASAAWILSAHAEAHPSALTWRLASLALTWDGERERAAAKAAARATRLAPGDPALAAGEEAAVDALLWAEMREASRPAAAIAGVVLALAFFGWLGRRVHARRRREWIDAIRARLVVNADGSPVHAGAQPLVTPDTRGLALDVFLDGAGPMPARDGPTLSVVLSHGRESRIVRLTPVKDVRQDALRVRLSDTTLAEVRAHPGRWRVSVALDGRHVGEAALLVESALAAARR
jgi:hypothetical protein